MFFFDLHDLKKKKFIQEAQQNIQNKSLTKGKF